MEGYVNLALYLIFLYATAVLSIKYRDDYEYHNKTDALYKLHTESRTSKRAREICTTEGAKLMAPTTKKDIDHFPTTLFNLSDSLDRIWVDNGHQHESELEELPFVCKVDAKDVQYDSQCGVYVSDYQYLPSIATCYKVHSAAYTWQDADAECREEGAHLVIINSKAERLALKEFLRTAPKIDTAKADYLYYAGISADRPTNDSERVFRTIFNETLKEAGFRGWSNGEPNNSGDSEYCGAISRNTSKYNDVDCKDQYGFICEKAIHHLRHTFLTYKNKTM